MNKNNIAYVPDGSWLTFIKKIKNGSWKKNEPIQKATALYRCKCGKEHEYDIISVKCGKRKSCGCKPRTHKPGLTHGLSKHPLYWVWSSMKDRCYNKNKSVYIHYGGRGVIVCDEWRTDPKAFIDWALKNGWRPGLELDKDVKAKELGIEPLIYSPDMCQFITSSENCSARRSNRLIEYNGKTQTLNKWAIEVGIKRETIARRLDVLGFSIERALSVKVKRALIKNKEFKKIRSGGNSPKAKKIKQINICTNEVVCIYEAIILAQYATGIGNRSISAALRGQNKTAGGYKWEYA